MNNILLQIINFLQIEISPHWQTHQRTKPIQLIQLQRCGVIRQPPTTCWSFSLCWRGWILKIESFNQSVISGRYVLFNTPHFLLKMYLMSSFLHWIICALPEICVIKNWKNLYPSPRRMLSGCFILTCRCFSKKRRHESWGFLHPIKKKENSLKFKMEIKHKHSALQRSQRRV